MEKWGASLLTNENASGLLASVDMLSQKAGTKDIKVYRVPNIPGFGNLGKINAAAIDKDKIVLTDGILECFNNTNLQQPTDQRLEAVIGHELDHCMKFDKTMRERQLPLLLMPLVAVIGYHIYRKVQEKKKEQQPKAIEDEAKELHKNVVKENEAPAQGWQKKAITFGKYFASALLGLAAGLLISRQYSLKYEREADAFSKELMGSGEPLAQGLEVLEREMHKLVAREGIGNVSTWKLLIGSLFHAHPSTPERTTTLRS